MPTYTVYPGTVAQSSTSSPAFSTLSNIQADDNTYSTVSPFVVEIDGEPPDPLPANDVTTATSETVTASDFDFAGAGLTSSEVVDSVTVVVGCFSPSGTYDLTSPDAKVRFSSLISTINGVGSGDLSSQNSGNLATSETAYSFTVPGTITAMDILAGVSVAFGLKGVRGDTGAGNTWVNVLPYVNDGAPPGRVDYVRVTVETSLGGAKIFKSEFASPKVFGGMSL